MAEPLVRILVLTEDSARDAHDVLRALLAKMLKQVEPTVRTNQVDLYPSANPTVDLVCRANRWRGRDGGAEQARRSLVLTIAETLLQNDPPHFVALHFDGDKPWSRRHQSAIRADFERQVVRPVERAVGTKVGPDEVARRMARLLVVQPFYSIEAWTYQHTAVAARECRKRGCGRHVPRFEAWALDRGLLDEISKPKEHVRCLGSDANLVLGGPGFPADAVLSAGKSWYATVLALRNVTDLAIALAGTT